MIIDKEDFEVQQSNSYWAGRLIGNPQAWEIANEIVEAIEYALKKGENLIIPDVSNNDIDLDNINVKVPPNKTTKYKLIPKKAVSVCGSKHVEKDAWCWSCKVKDKCELYKTQTDC